MKEKKKIQQNVQHNPICKKLRNFSKFYVYATQSRVGHKYFNSNRKRIFF